MVDHFSKYALVRLILDRINYNDKSVEKLFTTQNKPNMIHSDITKLNIFD